MDDKTARPLLILDLDETLIHGSETRLHRDADFMIGPFHIYKRPHLECFLRSIAPHFHVAAWSSASCDYADGIASELAPYVPKWQFVWSRTRCVQRMDMEIMTAVFVTNLRKVKRRGYDLDRVLIIDDTCHKVSRNFGTAIYIEPYEGDDDDRELLQLAKYVKPLRDEPNFRRIETRGWRTKRFPN